MGGEVMTSDLSQSISGSVLALSSVNQPRGPRSPRSHQPDARSQDQHPCGAARSRGARLKPERNQRCSLWVPSRTRTRPHVAHPSAHALLGTCPWGIRETCHRPAISPDPDGQPAGRVTYRVASEPDNGPIPAVLSVAVERFGLVSGIHDRPRYPRPGPREIFVITRDRVRAFMGRP